MPALKHTHTYRRKRIKRRDGTTVTYYRCADPHCTATFPREDVIGKASLCNVCGDEFILSTRDTHKAKPKCKNCANTREAREFRVMRGLVESAIANVATVAEVAKADSLTLEDLQNEYDNIDDFPMPEEDGDTDEEDSE